MVYRNLLTLQMRNISEEGLKPDRTLLVVWKSKAHELALKLDRPLDIRKLNARGQGLKLDSCLWFRARRKELKLDSRLLGL
jgi:hypothetical protein